MDASNTARLAESLSDRLSTYTFLAALYRTEVTERSLEALRQDGVLDCADPELDDGLRMMRTYLASPEASVLDLARDYAKTFCGAASTNKTAAYPFESVYTSESGMLMQDARDDAMRWYRRFGIAKSESWHDCEDHLALELEFMAFLIGSCRDALVEGDTRAACSLLTAQHGFLEEHLANWVPEFARHVDLRARTGFYRGLGRFTRAYVANDRRELGAVREAIADDAAAIA
ncbi:molecular chaperone TorD family protein [Eggerthella sp. NSJ-70]|uniref:Molecular chaperone TorD family protein n=1 Tax=Eggerthella hominis TaxID=2763043 RepID=A0ABR7BNM8_9ACTN|nr:molecular chaperone TorD family protein [Eggerthella hominis]MBC5583213.1 molecular chaperone TorD family protein [Eggerthella hominis]